LELVPGTPNTTSLSETLSRTLSKMAGNRQSFRQSFRQSSGKTGFWDKLYLASSGTASGVLTWFATATGGLRCTATPGYFLATLRVGPVLKQAPNRLQANIAFLFAKPR